MKTYLLLIFIVTTGCAQHYDWRIENYVVGIAKNKSSQDITITYCNTNPSLSSRTELIPADGKEYRSKILVDYYIDKTFDRPQNYIPENWTYFQYPTLSAYSSAFAKICMNDNLETANNTFPRKFFLIINSAETCPEGFLIPHQPQGVCL